MRTEYVSGSAGALVVGAMSLVLGFTVQPLSQEQTVSGAVLTVDRMSGQWLVCAAALFAASVGLTLGLVSLLTVMGPGNPVLRVVAVAVFAVGTVGMAGYATALVLLRALVLKDLLLVTGLNQITDDLGVRWFIATWLGCFLAGIVLVALGFWLARSTPRWVPILMVAFVLSQLVPLGDGPLVTAVQFLALAVAFTGAAIAANNASAQRPEPRN